MKHGGYVLVHFKTFQNCDSRLEVGIIQTLGFFEESDHSNEKPIARHVTRVLVMKVSFEIYGEHLFNGKSI